VTPRRDEKMIDRPTDRPTDRPASSRGDGRNGEDY
jgi:hypothetical protein